MLTYNSCFIHDLWLFSLPYSSCRSVIVPWHVECSRIVLLDFSSNLELTWVYELQIKQSFDSLTNAVVTKNAPFYLRGPTWPSPAISVCLEDIVRNEDKNRDEEIKLLNKRRL